MILRRFLLIVGVFALIAGIGLALLSVREQTQFTAARVAPPPEPPRQQVLAAARDFPAGTLLRSDDVKYIEMAPQLVPSGAFLRGKQPAEEVLGTAARRAYHADEVIVADQIIRPTDAGFLPVVLSPGMRAISLNFSAASGGSGLIQPGDRVDVILTQALSSRLSGGFIGEGQPLVPSGSPNGSQTSLSSVGETILRDIRVIAVFGKPEENLSTLSADESTGSPKSTAAARPTGKGEGPARPAPSQTQSSGSKPPVRMPDIITLEVTGHQAEVLTVALKLGQLQLTLRSAHEGVEETDISGPTWATEVSRALRVFEGQAASPQDDVPAPPAAVAVVRGGKAEQRCFNEKLGIEVLCAGGVLPPVAPSPVTNRGPGAPLPNPLSAPMGSSRSPDNGAAGNPG